MEPENYLMALGEEKALQALEEANSYTRQFGLVLKKEDEVMLLKERKEVLRGYGRVEFGEGILPKLIFAFCDSSYIDQDNYAEMMAELQEIFYLYKNETLDQVPDEELLEQMREAFEGECEGSTEYLATTALEEYARSIRIEGKYTLSTENYKIRRKWERP